MSFIIDLLELLAKLTAVAAAVVVSVSVLHALMRLVGWIARHSVEQHPGPANPAGTAHAEVEARRRWYDRMLGTPSSARDETRLQFRSIQVGLSRSLVMGLELLLAAEVMHTVTLVEKFPLASQGAGRLWNGIGIVAATAALRVLLSYFLGVEIRRAETESKEI